MAERTFTTSPRPVRVENETSCESQEDSVYSVPKRQKELVKLKYASRRRRFRKKVEKTPASSSDSEQAAKKSFELLRLNYCDTSLSVFSCNQTSCTSVQETLPSIDTGFTCKPLLETSFEKQIEEDLSSLPDISNTPPKEKNSNWYSHLFGSFFDYVANHLFSPKENAQISNNNQEELNQLDYEQDFNENVEDMAKNASIACVEHVQRVLQRVAQFCPQHFTADLNQRCVLPLKHKLNQRGVTIGICGKSQHAKKVLMKVIERMPSTDIRNVSYRLCSNPSLEDEMTLPFLESSSSWKCFLTEQATCAAYVYVLSGERCPESLESLKWLVDRDADVITQGRLLLLANQDKPGCHIEDPLLEQFITHPTLHTNYTQSPMITSCSDISSTTAFTTSTGSTQCTVTQSTHSIEPHLYTNNSLIVTSTPNAAATSRTDKTVEPFPYTDNTLSTVLKVQAFAERITGISVPTNCIFLTPLLEVTEEQQENEYRIEIEDEKVESLTSNEEFGIGQQLTRFSVNCDMLRQLSITSDTLYCIEYCSGKLQCVLDDANENITKLEELLIHKNHLMGEMKRLWTILETRVKDSTLYEDLATSYDRDLKTSVVTTKECVIDILQQFRATCVAKLEKLPTNDSRQSKFWSLEGLCEFFKADIEMVKCKILRCLQTIHSNVMFLDMHNTLQQRCCNFDELLSLQQLSEAYLSLETSSEDISDSTSYCDANITVYPCGSQTIGYECQFESISVNETLQSILLDSISRILHTQFKLKKIDLKKVTRKFVSQCVQCLDSAAMKTQAVQFHVELMSNVILERLSIYRQQFIPRFKYVNQQLEYDLLNAKKDCRITEAHFKHLVNLKVYLELKKSFLSCCLK